MYLRKKRRPVSEINVVPYIDVMLVLLIIFMATAPLITHGVKVELPKMEQSELVDTKGEPPIIASIDADGKYYVSANPDPEEALEAAEVVAIIQMQLEKSPKTPVMIKGSGQVSYQEVLRLMDILRKSGVNEVGLMTESFED
ncbi:protein TolR [Pseudoalteromonas sp. YIC-827]|uniref:Tol-Pal system protein TolR n=1 Tax=Pseudoalteromonas qingdaonensis TaxID=3131913 RepID=A0ABU9MTS2_9GAMM